MMSFVDILVLVAFILIVIDVIFQIKKVRKRHDSMDISMRGAFFRLVALLILLVKFIFLGEIVLLIGQVILVVVFVCYVIVLKHYHHKHKTYKRGGRG